MDESTGTYTVKVHAEQDGTAWAEVDELPGCFASGESIEELWTNLAEAIGLYLSSDEVSVKVEMQEPDPITVHTTEKRFAVC
ncbi:type II toxin-antitoxin system HicB family antitoxin [Nonomuraea sp. NPDC059194]|uniref:type II toxin-antitoxin system HicB family antitoxin n=1 Tax=Nonomuraea sp. NPDC059194 TaxID=3346764 RepID=UPI00369AFA97